MEWRDAVSFGVGAAAGAALSAAALGAERRRRAAAVTAGSPPVAGSATGPAADLPGPTVVRQPAPAAAREPANGPAREPANGPAREPANGPAREPANGPTREPANGPEDLPALTQAVLDAIGVGVLVIDPGDRVVLVNQAARRMGLIRPRDQPHTVIRTLVSQVRRGGRSRVIEFDLPRDQGVRGGRQEPFGVNVRAVALSDGLIAVEAADVTEAHRVARVRRDFVANVSHELKTPVGALRLLAEALIEATEAVPGRETTGGDDNGERPAGAGGDLVAARRFAERIQHESTRLGRLVTELIELSRLQGAEPLPDPEPVAVDRIVAEVVDRTRTAAAAKQIVVAVDGARGLTVYGNESQLVTALANLVENAIAYSTDGTRVRLDARSAQRAVEIDVADQGIGIDPQDLDRIFERFYRADGARSRATGGTGLGLAIVKHIATNHGGQVDVTSGTGVGSTFTLRLPARPREETLESPDHDEVGSRA